MDKNLAIIGGLIVLLICVVLNQSNQFVKASVEQGHEYHATTTGAAFFSATGISKVIQSYPGAFGSFIVGSTGTGIVTIYDATTSNALLRTNTATTTLGVIDTSKAVGTYTFDVIAQFGILAETNNLAIGSTTITTR